MFYALWMCYIFSSIQIASSEKSKHRASSGVDSMEHTWSGWSRWSPCSVTCGRGLRERYRECVGVVRGRVVRLEKPTCPGHTMHYKTCNLKDCHPGAEERRTYQCVQKNSQAVHGEKYNWGPFYGGTNPCELTCMAHGFTFFYNFGPVTDGTPCKRDGESEEEICVKGHCTRIGCDGHVGSNAVLDHCHKCNGHDIGCVLHKNVYSREQPPKGEAGYTMIVKVPKGSHYLRVDDTSRNYLAVADSKMNYIFNGNWVIDWPGTYQMSSTTLVYKRTFDGNETITATGPTGEDLHIMLMFRQKNPGISYGFRISEDKVDEVEEAARKSWVTTRVYERYQSQRATSTPIPNTAITIPTYSNATRNTANKVNRRRSNKANLERTSFHQDVFLGDNGVDKSRARVQGNPVDMDGIQNEASATANRRLRQRNRSNKNTHKVKTLSTGDSSNKKANGTDSTKVTKAKCATCRKANDKLKQYCESDFVVRALVLDYIFVGNETRYEVRVMQAYKQGISLLSREYIWTPGTRCRCPRLKINKEYYIVGKLRTKIESHETRLQIGAKSFIRLFSKSTSKRLSSIHKNAKC